MVIGTNRRTPDDVAAMLQELVLESVDVGDFLNELAIFSGAFFSANGIRVRCAFTVLRRKKAATVASSDAEARVLDEIQVRFAEGPCLSAMEGLSTIYVPDIGAETRWADYMAEVSGHDVGSILAIPLPQAGENRAALNLFATKPHTFSAEDIQAAERFASQASGSLRLALRIAKLADARNDLTAAMRSRTAIDIATGVVMAQNRCDQETAVRILKDASSTRNVKLREVAAGVVASVSGGSALSTHFDE